VPTYSAIGVRSVAIRGLHATSRLNLGLQPRGADSGDLAFVCATGHWMADISLHQVSDRQAAIESVQSGFARFVVGDLGEARQAGEALPVANATVIELDSRGSTVRLITSLTGLPPVFMSRQTPLASVSCPFMPESEEAYARPDIDGIADTLRWGHPLDGRTLFEHLSVALSNTIVSISAEGGVQTSSRGWPPASEVASLQVNELVAEQLHAFSQAAARVNTDHAFLSLSGGLDSRAALMALLSHDRRVPCVTMAGSNQNLDARLAQAFCATYGLRHQIILLGDSFAKQLHHLLPRAASLSGGVASLSQTVDLFMYDNLAGAYSTRISGNLGNQVGRGGVESLGAGHPAAEMFSAPVRERLAARPLIPWFIPRLAGNAYGETLFGQEVHFWSIANYVVGSSRALQLTPYADRRLLLLARELFTRDTALEIPTRKILRARDLRHRIWGTPTAFSFQRRFLAANDRLAKRVPLNWGWRAAGRSSLRWRVSAVASAADAAMIKLSGGSATVAPAAKWLSSRLGHRSALVDWRAMLKGPLREFALDVLSSGEVAQLDIFDNRAMHSMLTDHFKGKADRHSTIVRALEIALAFTTRILRR
jgi:hypothetical protein